MSEEEEKLIKARESIQEVYSIISEGRVKEIYDTLLKGGPNKPKYARLVGELPDFDSTKFTWNYLLKYGLIDKMAKTN
jgi:hypothetical protein